MVEFFDAIQTQPEFAANASHITHLMDQKLQWLVRQRDFEEADICIDKFYQYVEIFKLAGNDPLDCLYWTVTVGKTNMLLERQYYNETIRFVCQCLPQLKRQIAKAERRFKQEENKDDQKLLVTLLQSWVNMEKYRGQAWLRQGHPWRSLWVFNAILPHCRRLIELQSDNAILLAMIQGERTEAYSRIHRYKKAIKAANEAIRLFSKRSFRQTSETDIVYASVLRQRAAACWKLKLYVRGIADCKSGIAALADHVELNVPEAVSETAALYFQRALIHFDVGDRESTAREISRIRELVQRPCVVQLPEIVLMIAQAKVIFERLRIRR